MRKQAAQVYFDTQDYQKIKLVANQEGKAIAEWIRDVVNEELDKSQLGKKKWSSLPKFKSERPSPNLSENIKHFLYG